MPEPRSPAKSEQLTRLINTALAVLPKYLRSSAESEADFIVGEIARRLAFGVSRGDGDLLGSSGPISEFRKSNEFGQLVQFIMDDRTTLSTVTGQPQEEQLTRDRMQLLHLFVEKMLLKAVFAIRYQSVKADKTDLISEFVCFLEGPTVRRSFTVPLYHLQLESDAFDLGPVGRLTRATHPAEGIMPEVVARRVCMASAVLQTEFESHKFFLMSLDPVRDDLIVRIQLLRLVAGPLISFNECHIAHVEPWEERFSKHEIFTRNWSRGPGRCLWSKAETFTIQTKQEYLRLFAGLAQLDWKALTPWRIALNRLDEAIFKLETDSADAFFDVVTGLESVMVESDSLHESTHKVAVRTARYLETSSNQRQQTFRLVKKLYGLRSKIAHGKSLNLENENANLICTGALLLSRVLRRMLEDKTTQIDVNRVDLS